MNPAVWGPMTWASIHYIALGFPEKPSVTDKYNYKTFYETLAAVLPCKVCSEHFAAFQKKEPIDAHLGSRKALFEWTVNAHNNANRILGKQEWTVEAAWDFYNAKGALKEGFVAPYESGSYNASTGRHSQSKWLLSGGLVLVALIVAAAAYGAFRQKRFK